jgi:hypothetical protein
MAGAENRKKFHHAPTEDSDMKAADRRNLNPTAPAYVAMALWGRRYSQQNGGSMDFWDKLTEYEQRTCRELAKQIREAKMDE